MAKQTKSVTASVQEGAPALKPEEKGKNDVFVRIMENGKGVAPSKKIAPQATIIVNVIEAMPDNRCSRAELVTALGDGVTGALKTRQPVGRIVSYYQKEIQEVGCVSLEKSAPAAA